MSLDDARLHEASGWCLRLTQGDLTAAERAAFEAWLETSALNRAAFDEAVVVWRAMEETSLTPELIDIRRDALESFRRASRSRWTRGISRRAAAAAAACVVLAMAGAGAWIRYAPKVYETGVGERRVVVLSDGSKISLDAQTRVDVRYRGDRRALRLDHGRAKFNVAKDALKPFSVAVGDKVVVATGTSFSVELLSRRIHVILYDGRVAVLEKASAGRPAPIRLSRRPVAADVMLTPGRELVTTIDAPVAVVEQTDPARSLSWEAGQLVFADQPLATAVEQVNRYSSEKLQIGDAAAGRVLVNGVFTAGDTAAFADGVTAVSPLVLRNVDGKMTFVTKP